MAEGFNLKQNTEKDLMDQFLSDGMILYKLLLTFPRKHANSIPSEAFSGKIY